MFAYCRVCNSHTNVSYGGKHVLVRHASTAGHVALVKATKSQPQMRSFYVSRRRRSYWQTCCLRKLRLHNLSQNTTCPLPSPITSQNWRRSCSLTAWLWGGLHRNARRRHLHSVSMPTSWSFVRTVGFPYWRTKATTRVGRSLVILVKVFDVQIDRAATRFLDIPVCNIRKGENIFNTIDDCLRYLLIFLLIIYVLWN